MNFTFLYLAAIYFLAVLLWRRLATPIPWAVAAFFYLLVLLFLFKPLTQHFVIVPADITPGLYPWRGNITPPLSQNPEINDVILQFVPWAHQVRESWKHLEAPLWNNAAGAGYPLLANGQSCALSPLRLLGLPLTLGQSFTLEAALKLLLALTGSYVYMRRRFSNVASILTAISFSFCTFLIVWLNFPHTSVSAFLPWLFVAVEFLFEKVSLRRVIFCAVVFLMLLVNGHPEMAAFSVLAAGLLVLWKVLVEKEPGRWRATGAVTLAGIIALILALPVLLPFLEALPLSQRYDLVRASGVPLLRLQDRMLVSFLQPRFFGTFMGRDIWGPGNGEFISGYAGVFAVAAWFAFLIDLLRRRAWRDPLFFFVALSPVLLWIIMGWPWLSDAFHRAPVFSMAASGRLRMVLCWFLAVLAGAALDRFFTATSRLPLAIGVAAVAVSFAWIFYAVDFGKSVNMERALSSSWPAFGVLAVALLALYGLRSWPGVAASLLVVAVTIDLLVFAIPWTPVVPESAIFPTTHLIEAALHHPFATPGVLKVNPYRIAGTSANFFPNSAAMYGFEDIRAHDPMANTRSLGALRIFAGYSSDDYFAMLGKVDHPLIDFLNVRFVICSPNEPLPSDHFALVYSGRDGRLYQNRRVLPRFYAVRNVIVEFDDTRRMNLILNNQDWENSTIVKRLPTWLIDQVRGDLFGRRPENAPAAKVTVIRSSAREHLMRIKAPRWTFIASSQPDWPGWRIYRGDEELHSIQTNGLFTGFLAPPGDSVVRMVYNPRSFYVGVYASALCFALLLFLLARDQRERRKHARSAAFQAAVPPASSRPR